jgi:hypothetical protein
MRLVVADRSRHVADIGAVRDSARRLLRPGDALVVFDSAARVVSPATARDTAASLRRSAARGLLSTALVAARREAARSRDRADSLELDIISPLSADEIDAATPRIRTLWRGRIRVVRVSAAAAATSPPVIALRGAADDPLRVVASLRAVVAAAAAGDGGSGTVRVVRDAATASDSAWARGGPAGGPARVLIIWPAVGVAPPWPARTRTDTAGAVVVFRPSPVAVVAAFPRLARLDTAGGVRAIARWADGEPAAVERPLGAGCVRDVAIAVPPTGDFVLRPEVARLVGAVLAPCGGDAGAGAPASPGEVAALAGQGPLLARRDIAVGDPASEPVVPWLLGAALLLMLAEVRVRRTAAERTDGPTVAAGGGP